MKKIFDQIIDRKDYFERKWDPLYVEQKYGIIGDFINASIADLDFPSPAVIQQAILKRASQSTYSYSYVPSQVTQAIANWYQKRHNLIVKAQDIKVVHGTVNLMHQLVQCLTNINDNILLQTPIYAPFARSILNNNRNIIENKLIYDQENKTYQIDFTDFEQKIKTYNIKLFMLCSPHNPGERVWTKQQLEKMFAICQKYNVYVFSDEVHSDLVFNEFYSLLQSENQTNLIVANSPNKSFNLGGLKGSYLITRDQKLSTLIEKHYTACSLTPSNVFVTSAFLAAYNDDYCLQWLKQLLQYCFENYLYLKQQLESIDKVEIMQMQAAFLVWINYQNTKLNEQSFLQLLKEQKLIVGIDTDFYGYSKGWFRVNIGCPRKTLEQIIERLKNIFS